MKPEIENLKAWMSGKITTGYQRALAMREFEQLLTYVAELEQLRKHAVSGRSELLVCGNCLNNHTNKEYEGYCSQSCFDGIK